MNSNASRIYCTFYVEYYTMHKNERRTILRNDKYYRYIIFVLSLNKHIDSIIIIYKYTKYSEIMRDIFRRRER